ncbi:MAG: HU family DNA-binding protein [Dysgonamonadaceae bacterium]|jgi:nucleoid DNA-binding protein|nr:HU family DNA-binding protein [Dysgonamonadaceae bacterium]
MPTKKDFIVLLFKRMNEDDEITKQWVDAYTDTLIDIFKTGKGVTINGLDGFYVDRRKRQYSFQIQSQPKSQILFGAGINIQIKNLYD